MSAKTIVGTIIIALMAFSFDTPSTQAQAPQGQEYIIQVDDWLSKLSDKFYGDIFAYTAIIEATNAKAAEDDNYAPITNPDVIEVGQKLWIPTGQDSDSIVVNGISFDPAAVELLGMSTVVPNTWTPIEDDPLSENVWRAGLFSFVEFSTTPGTNGQYGLAQLLRTTYVSLNNGSIGGELTGAEIGGKDWTIYTRSEGAVTVVAAATVQGNVVYLIRLSSENSQSNTILNTILENYQVIDPTAAQQEITLQTPNTGTSLTNPFELRGTTRQYPFRGALVYRVWDAEGNVVGQSPFEVVGRLGHPATFALPATYDVQSAGPGMVQVAEISPADGTVIAFDQAEVLLEADPPGIDIFIQDPLPFTSISPPVQIRGKTSDRPFETKLNYRIIDANGAEIVKGVFILEAQLGQVNNFDNFVDFTVTTDGPGRIEVYDIRPADGTVSAIDTVNVWLKQP